MLNIDNHQRNANQNHTELSSHLCQNADHQKEHTQQTVRMWGRGKPCTRLVGMKTGAATAEHSMEVPQKLKRELPYSPAIPLQGIYLKKNKPENTNLKRYMHPNVHSSIA